MVRASTLGMIDFSEFDPWDKWWWRKLDWTLDELEREQSREVMMAQLCHWDTLATVPGLQLSAYESMRENGDKALNNLMTATWPWLADKIGEAGTHASREQAIKDHQERWGKPGEERYEKMIAKSRKILRHKLTKREKQQLRQRREQQSRERQKLREMQGA